MTGPLFSPCVSLGIHISQERTLRFRGRRCLVPRSIASADVHQYKRIQESLRQRGSIRERLLPPLLLGGGLLA